MCSFPQTFLVRPDFRDAVSQKPGDWSKEDIPLVEDGQDRE